MRQSSYLFIALTVFTFCFSCSKSVLTEDAPHILVADNLFTNKAGFEAGLNGLYDEVRRIRSGANYGLSTGFISGVCYVGVDNAYSNFPGGPETVLNNWGSVNNASNNVYSNLWNWLYETINAANTVIDRSGNPDIEWTEAEKNQILAQARIIRAWCYRHATFLWGDVPLTLHESKGSNIITDWERTPVAEVRDSIEADLLFAEKYLPEVSNRDGTILKGAAQIYLAELYLAKGRPDLAKPEALKVTQNPNYKLVTQRYGVNKNNPGTPFTDMFIGGNSSRSAGNTEALWVFENELNVIGGEGYNLMFRFWGNRYETIKIGGKSPFLVVPEYGGRSIARFGVTKFAFANHEPQDDRGSAFSWRYSWVINNPQGVPSGYHFGDTVYLDTTNFETSLNMAWPNTRKWDNANPDNPSANFQYDDQVYLRAADAWLLLAEANLGLGDNEGAADALNEVRSRSNASPVNPEDVTLDFILDERSRELVTEEERRYTLLRTRTWLERTRKYNHLAGPNITDRDTLLPIPQSVIDANITKPMRQNPGY